MTDTSWIIARAVRTACVEEAALAWERAGLAGLCLEGRWEAVLDALRTLDLGEIVASAAAARNPGGRLRA